MARPDLAASGCSGRAAFSNATPHSKSIRKKARAACAPRRRSRACAAGSAMRRRSKARRRRRECACAPVSTQAKSSSARSAMPKSRRNSYAVFRRLRDDGVIPHGVKFQVSLPTTAAFLNAHVVYSQHAIIEPIYRAQLLAEVRQMANTIAPSDLAVQWDVSTEMGQWESVRHAYFDDVQKGVVDRLTIHCNAVPNGIELGIHLCYGDYGHRHWKEPATTANMVAVYNALSERVTRPINWLHMPVPRSRDDDAYYAPLRDLRLKPGNEALSRPYSSERWGRGHPAADVDRRKICLGLRRRHRVRIWPPASEHDFRSAGDSCRALTQKIR